MPRRMGPSVPRKIYLSTELDNKLKLLLGDPHTSKLQYGSLNELVETLLWNHIAKVERAAKEI